MPGSSSDLEAPEEVDPDDEEEEDEAYKARKRLGMPEYDPDESMLTSMPKILPLVRNNMHFLSRNK